MLFPKNKLRKINTTLMDLNKVDNLLLEVLHEMQSVEIQVKTAYAICNIQDKLLGLTIMTKEIQSELLDIEGHINFKRLSGSIVNSAIKNAKIFINESMTLITTAKHCIAA